MGRPGLAPRQRDGDPQPRGDLHRALLQGVPERPQRLVAPGASRQRAAGRGAEARGGHRIQGPGAQTSLLAASPQQRPHQHPGARHHRADPLGPPELVGRQRDRVGAAPEPRLDAPRRLHGVQMKLGAVALGQLQEPRDRLDRPGLVVHRVGGQEHRLTRQARGQGLLDGVR